MKRLKLFRWAAVLALAIAATPNSASAQEADTLSISGTFHMDEIVPEVGDDLATVYANGNEHGWTLTLYEVTISYDYDEWTTDGEYGDYYEVHFTRVHATSFDFEFFGPDADILNQVVSSQLVQGSLTNGAFLELRNYFYSDPYGETQTWTNWDFGVLPGDPLNGVAFSAEGFSPYIFSADENGYPVAPRLMRAGQTEIIDYRPENNGSLKSYRDYVSVGEVAPTIGIPDKSVREGNHRTTELKLTVLRFGNGAAPVTVDFTTASGTALDGKDYYATSGTLTIPAGQTYGTISIGVKGDRRREPDETFTVHLSNAVGATIEDGVATVTIVNDD